MRTLLLVVVCDLMLPRLGLLSFLQLSLIFYSVVMQLLSFVDTAPQLGHLLNFNLGDAPDITHKFRDMVRKANYVLVTFSSVHKLYQSYCLSLYGSSLWSLSCSALRSLEVAFNYILRKICLCVVTLVLCTPLPTCSNHLLLSTAPRKTNLFRLLSVFLQWLYLVVKPYP